MLLPWVPRSDASGSSKCQVPEGCPPGGTMRSAAVRAGFATCAPRPAEVFEQLAEPIAILPLFVPVIFIVLELLFGTIQALVFALLTAIYITMAAGDSHGGEHAQHAEDEDHGSEPSTVGRVPAAAGD